MEFSVFDVLESHLNLRVYQILVKLRHVPIELQEPKESTKFLFGFGRKLLVRDIYVSSDVIVHNECWLILFCILSFNLSLFLVIKLILH